MPSWSPYNYTFQNPVRYVDPDGSSPFDHYFSSEGRYLGSDNRSTNDIRVMQNSYGRFSLFGSGSFDAEYAYNNSTTLNSFNYSDKQNVSMLKNIASYHPDHLGSSSYISNRNNEVSQHMEYLPFGELLVDEHKNSYNTPYKFNAKELDEETGNYYYGARYYDPKFSIWLSVDPLAEKYPSISSYAYVANNPINAIDPDGRKIIFINGKLGGGSPKGGKAYWNSSFVNGAKDYMHDNSVYYANTDYAYLSSAKGRTNQGYEWAKENYATLIDGLGEGETFKMVSHSMGGAYSKGVEKYLEEQGHTVEMNVMINTFEVDDIDVQDNDSTYNIDYQNTDDPVLYWFDGNIGKGKLKDANSTIREESGEDCYMCKHRSPIDGGRKFWDNLDQKIIDAEKSKTKE